MGLFQTKLLQKMAEMDRLQTGLAQESALSRSHLSRVANGRVPLGARAAGKIIAALSSEKAGAELLAAYLYDEIAKVQAAVDDAATKKSTKLDLYAMVTIAPGRTSKPVEAQPLWLRSVDRSRAKDLEKALTEVAGRPEKRALLQHFLRALSDRDKA